MQCIFGKQRFLFWSIHKSAKYFSSNRSLRQNNEMTDTTVLLVVVVIKSDNLPPFTFRTLLLCFWILLKKIIIYRKVLRLIKYRICDFISHNHSHFIFSTGYMISCNCRVDILLFAISIMYSVRGMIMLPLKAYLPSTPSKLSGQLHCYSIRSNILRRYARNVRKTLPALSSTSYGWVCGFGCIGFVHF